MVGDRSPAGTAKRAGQDGQRRLNSDEPKTSESESVAGPDVRKEALIDFNVSHGTSMTIPEKELDDPTARICRVWNEMDPALRNFSARNAPGKQDDYRWFLEWIGSLDADDVIVTIDHERSTGTLEAVMVPFEDSPSPAGSRGPAERVDGLLAAPFSEVRDVLAVTARHPNGRPARFRLIARIVLEVDVNRKDRPWSDETVLAWINVRFEPAVFERSVDVRGRTEDVFVIGLAGCPVMVFDEDTRTYAPVDR